MCECDARYMPSLSTAVCTRSRDHHLAVAICSTMVQMERSYRTLIADGSRSRREQYLAASLAGFRDRFRDTDFARVGDLDMVDLLVSDVEDEALQSICDAKSVAVRVVAHHSRNSL